MILQALIFSGKSRLWYYIPCSSERGIFVFVGVVPMGRGKRKTGTSSFAEIRSRFLCASESLLQQRYGVGDGLLHGFAAVLVHVVLVLFAVGQAASAVDAAAQAGHALDEVAAQDLGVLGQLQ